MQKCPHCGGEVNLLRWLVTARWHPYKCDGCGKFSRISITDISFIEVLIIGGVLGLGEALVSNFISHYLLWSLEGMIFLFFLFCKTHLEKS